MWNNAYTVKPTHSNYVLALGHNNYPFTLRWVKDHWITHNGKPIVNIKYWMEIPSAPEE